LKKNKKEAVFLNASKAVSVITVLALVLFAVMFRDYITVENVLRITPRHREIVSLFLIGLYILKSLTILFPAIVLYVVSGIVLPLPFAILVNLMGMFIENTLQYAVGYSLGSGLSDYLEEKYLRFRKFGDIMGKSEFFVSYILRITPFLPVGIVSLLLGGKRIDFKKYTSGSLLGMAPFMIAATSVGMNILNPFSLEFVISCSLIVLIIALSFLYLRLRKRVPQKRTVKTRPKWVRIVFRRRVFVIFLLVLQVLLIVLMFLSAGTNYSVFAPVMSIISYGAAIFILGAEDKPAYKLTWVVLILAFPFFGGMFYLIIRNQWTAKSFDKKFKTAEKQCEELLFCDEGIKERLKEFDTACYLNSNYLYSYAGFPMYEHTSVQYFKSGEEKFIKLVSELKKAEKFIFLEYFIISQGYMWETILKILEEKAKAGVDVRVIFDDIGCFMLLPKNYHKTLEKANIKCVLFNPFAPILSTVQNNRDHRKIAVIDGKVAFTGGVNIGDEYINREERFGHWKDCAIMVRGKAVWSFTVMFLQMWNVFRKDDEDFNIFKVDTDQTSDGFVQPYSDRPLDEKAVVEHVYMSIINRACDYLYITTPYLILEDSMASALCEAAKCGVDVKIITPRVPDKAYVHLTTRSYYAELIRAGVKIYEYKKGFIHSKVFLSDDKTASVGTANADYRSLYLHFECGVLIHGCKTIYDIKKDFLETLDECIEIKESDCKRNLFIRIIQRLLRLFAPLM